MTDPAGDGGNDEVSAVLAEVRDSVTPGQKERDRLEAATTSLINRASAAIAALPSPADEADVLRVGSTARGTWLAGDRDIDLFVRFPTELSRSELERYGLRVGHDTIPEGREEYAEHPYVTGTYDGFEVDLVPCYDVDDATQIRSSVDRTPFHTAYLDERLDRDLAREVRVLKAFLAGIGVYGSDLRTRGFSGYLTELLALEFGDARRVIEAAADWHPPVRLDPESHGDPEAFEAPLVVVDPTDPGRNVAAVLSAENLARMQHHCRDFLRAPSQRPFAPEHRDPIQPAAVRTHLDRRDTTPIAIVFDVPPLVDDQLYPQLRRSVTGLNRDLEERGFQVLRTAVFAQEDAASETNAPSRGARRAVLLVELATAQLPTVERHEGPPVQARDHAAAFYRKYADVEDAYGPFLDGDRYVVERERDEPDAVRLVESDALFDVALGSDVADALRDGYEVLAGEAVATLAEPFGLELRRYFEPDV